MRKWSFVVLLVLGAGILGATVLREPIARAAQTVDATIIGPLDGQGNVAVHEQGTANVRASQSGDWSVRDRDSGALQPYTVHLDVHLHDGDGAGTTVSAPVPTGKRLVIEVVSVQATVPEDQFPTVELVTDAAPFSLPMHFSGNEGAPTDIRTRYVANALTRIYVNPGERFNAFIFRGGATAGDAGLAMSVSGYLVDIS
jgi:hypothetical protein